MLLAAFFPARALDPPFFLSLDTIGTGAMRNGDYGLALARLVHDTAVTDTAAYELKLGLSHFNLGHYAEAVRFLREAADRNTLFVPIAYECIGDIMLDLRENANAVTAYRAAMSAGLSDAQRRAIREKIYGVLKSDCDLARDIPWLSQVSAKTGIANETWVPEYLDTLLSTARWKEADSLVSLFIADSSGSQGCRVYKILRDKPIPDSQLTTWRIFGLARLAFRCGKYEDVQDWLQEARKRPDFRSAVSPREMLYLEAFLDYRMKNYTPAIKHFERYEKNYGLAPEIVLSLARIFRDLDKPAKSMLWYDKYLQLYPKDPRTGEILWMRARQEEDDGDRKKAIRFFRTLFRKYPKSQWADDALFRSGLCFFKLKQFDSSVAVFVELVKKHPQSAVAASADYWRARSLESNRKIDDAKNLYRQIAASNPSDYYACRAREHLLALADSTVQFVYDTISDYARTRQWLDSVSPAPDKSVSAADSILARSGAALALAGRTDKADLLLSQLSQKYPRNLLLHFDCSLLYQFCGDPTRSFSIGRKIGWRIPQDIRQRIPLNVYEILYPFPYQSHILQGTVRFGIDPFLVCSVMRQESVFNPQATSPVGAIGLMQIMPYTGKDIAKFLGVSFETDSLYAPSVSIAFGAAYLKELLKQFNGNMLLAIAAYNGGPPNAKRWYGKGKDDPEDLFIENIGFAETREYVKKVLANYWVYQKLAGPLGYPRSQL